MTTATRAEPAGVYHRRRLEPVDRYRVPSGYPRCRAKRCHQPPAADMNRGPHPRTGKLLWYAYCADHLAGYNREVVDGRVWWRGAHIGAEYACGNCQQLIRLGPAPEAEGGPYWYHVSTSTIWCSGWGDPASTGAVAEPGS